MEPRRHRWLLLFVLAAAPWLVAPKCIEQDPYYHRAAVPQDSGTSTTSADAAVVGFVPAVACPARDDGFHAAQILITNRTYVIECGCAEANGKTCTIPRPTVLTWHFADSEEHDVSSVGSTFGESGDRIAGNWAVTFLESGAFPYVCNIHSADMNGYTIVVQ